MISMLARAVHVRRVVGESERKALQRVCTGGRHAVQRPDLGRCGVSHGAPQPACGWRARDGGQEWGGARREGGEGWGGRGRGRLYRGVVDDIATFHT